MQYQTSPYSHLEHGEFSSSLYYLVNIWFEMLRYTTSTDFSNRWCKRENVEPDALKEEKINIFKIIDTHISFFS